MKIVEIYNTYQIPPHLQKHQLYVAAVAKSICDNLSVHIDSNIAVTVGLLHDMGNILKFNFYIFDPKIYKPKGKKYWMHVQKKFMGKYGKDEHKATLKILNELKVDKKIVETISNMEFDKMPQISDSDDMLIKVCKYSDLRVAPHGVTSIEERIKDGRERYVIKKKKYTHRQFDELEDYTYKIEKQIFKSCLINPEDITNESTKRIANKLHSFEIITNGV